MVRWWLFTLCLLVHPLPIPWLSLAPYGERERKPPPRVPYAKTVTPDCFCYPPAAAATAQRFLSVKGVFRSLRRATKGAAFGIRKPLKRFDRNFFIWGLVRDLGRSKLFPFGADAFFKNHHHRQDRPRRCRDRRPVRHLIRNRNPRNLPRLR